MTEHLFITLYLDYISLQYCGDSWLMM